MEKCKFISSTCRTFEEPLILNAIVMKRYLTYKHFYISLNSTVSDVEILIVIR